jgi:hypothetical protein
MAVSKRFGRFKDEDEKAVRAPQVIEDQTLKRLKEAWQSVKYVGYLIEANYREVLDAIKGVNYSSTDVEKFCVALAEFQDEDQFSSNAGIFLSALINNCTDNDFVINTRHFSEGIALLGYQNTKNILVSGDVGAALGLEMKCGTITVRGNAGESVGIDMIGRRITVEGHSGMRLGAGMLGGIIEVKGNAGQLVGTGMRGGEIRIEGECEGLPHGIAGGKIYHKGKMILPRAD